MVSGHNWPWDRLVGGYLHGVPQCYCNVFSVSINRAYVTYKGHVGQMPLLGKLTNLAVGLRKDSMAFWLEKKSQIC